MKKLEISLNKINPRLTFSLAIWKSKCVWARLSEKSWSVKWSPPLRWDLADSRILSLNAERHRILHSSGPWQRRQDWCKFNLQMDYQAGARGRTFSSLFIRARASLYLSVCLNKSDVTPAAQSEWQEPDHQRDPFFPNARAHLTRPERNYACRENGVQILHAASITRIMQNNKPLAPHLHKKVVKFSFYSN